MVEQLVPCKEVFYNPAQLHFGLEEEIEAFFFIFRFSRRIIFAERDPKAFILCTPSTPTPAFFSFSAHFFPYSPRGFPSLSLSGGELSQRRKEEEGLARSPVPSPAANSP